METKLSPPEQAVLIREESSFFPLDLIVRKPQEVKKRIRLGDFFLNNFRKRKENMKAITKEWVKIKGEKKIIEWQLENLKLSLPHTMQFVSIVSSV